MPEIKEQMSEIKEQISEKKVLEALKWNVQKWIFPWN
jgi:hypothetical protein